MGGKTKEIEKEQKIKARVVSYVLPRFNKKVIKKYL